MKVTFEMDELKEILENYYKEQDGVDAEVTIEVSREVDRFNVEHMSTVTLTRKINILGKERTCEDNLTQKEMARVLKEKLINEDYEVGNIEFEYGTTSESKGYGLCEQIVYVPYYNAVVTVTKKDIKKYAKKINY